MRIQLKVDTDTQVFKVRLMAKPQKQRFSGQIANFAKIFWVLTYKILPDHEGNISADNKMLS